MLQLLLGDESSCELFEQRCNADFFFLHCKDIFLGSKAPYTASSPFTPSAGHTSSHSAVLVLPSLQLPDKPDGEIGPSNFSVHTFF